MKDLLWTRRIDRRSALRTGAGLLGAAAFGLPMGSGLAAPAEAGAVDELRGNAQAELESRKRDLRPRERVFIGDMVSTAESSLLTLKLGARTTLKLGARAQMRIDRYLTEAGGVFDLVSGPLMFERTGPKAKGDIEFRSAYGLMAVRGTRFYAGMNRGRFAVLVGIGRVDVTGGGQTVSLGPQEGTDIEAPGAAPSPAGPWGEARIWEMVSQFR